MSVKDPGEEDMYVYIVVRKYIWMTIMVPYLPVPDVRGVNLAKDRFF